MDFTPEILKIKRIENGLSQMDLGIMKDCYSLKHSNLDETANLLDIAHASKMASHTSVNTTMKFYTSNEEERVHIRLKGLDNAF